MKTEPQRTGKLPTGHPRGKARAHGWFQSTERSGAEGTATPPGLGLDAECPPGASGQELFQKWRLCRCDHVKMGPC